MSGNMQYNNFDLEAQQPQQPQQQAAVNANDSILKRSSHPVALVFHALFRTLAIVLYLIPGIAANQVLAFVLIVLCCAFDFWTVKNISGRLLVGLRWWNEVRDDGTNTWIFESRGDPSKINATDSRFFWVCLYVYPVVWILFATLALFGGSLDWLLVSIVSLILLFANLIGYTKCERDAKKKLAGWAANNSMVSNFVGSMISNRVSGFFGGNNQPAQPQAGTARV